GALPVVAAGLGCWVTQMTAAPGGEAGEAKDVRPAVTLPVTRVVLFNSGVGYFTRGGEVDGDTRVDLVFPEDDVNDLLKSMVLEDFGGGRVAAVSYDSREPMDRTIDSFAIIITGNRTFGGTLHQARRR